MELRVSVQDLSRVLSLTQGIVQRKNTMPILANVLVEVSSKDGGTLRVSATDLDVGIRTERPCEVIADGSVTIPARAIADMVRVLPGPDVHLKKLPNNHVEVKSGRTKAKLMGMSADEFPKLPSYDDVPFAKLDARLFQDMVDKTMYAASTDETRYNLNGVLFESAPKSAETNGVVVMVATDGHRLVRIERKFEGLDGEQLRVKDRSVILPRKGLGEIKRFLDAEDPQKGGTATDDALEVGLRDNHAVFRRGRTVLGMRLIDGAFPDYKQVIPSLSDKVVRISRGDFIESLKRVSVLASEKGQPVKLSLKKDELKVACINPDAGDIVDDMPVEYAGAAIDVAFNVRYLIDALMTLDGQNMLLKLTDNLSPGLVVGVDEPNHICVVMPMRL